MDDRQEDYHSLTHEGWCYLLSTIEVKEDRKRSATQIKKIASARAASISDSDGSVRPLRNKKAIIGAGVLRSNKVPNNKAPNHHGTQRHCVLYNKSGIPEQKYMSHSAEECFGKRANQKTINDGLGGPMGSRSEAVKQYKKSENKWNK